MTFVIAEIGLNHNGHPSAAKLLIDKAAAAGADAVKFQVFDAEKLDPPGERRNLLKKLQLSQSDLRMLHDHAGQARVEFMATPFDVDSLWFLLELGIKKIKIASGNLHNGILLEAAAATGLPVLISTGMSTMRDIEMAKRHAGKAVTWMHCTSSYPCPLKEANLQAMTMLEKPYGLSDHTVGLTAPILAVGLGASVIEKHITLDIEHEGPDHKCSLDPEKFAAMVTVIRNANKAMGNGMKRPMPSEKAAIETNQERIAWRATSS